MSPGLRVPGAGVWGPRSVPQREPSAGTEGLICSREAVPLMDAGSYPQGAGAGSSLLGGPLQVSAATSIL